MNIKTVAVVSSGSYLFRLRAKVYTIIFTDIDNFCWAGRKIFQTNVIDQIKKKFLVKPKVTINFKYLEKKISEF